MPKVSEFRDWHTDASTKLSDIVRCLGLSEIAIIWFFRQTIVENVENGTITKYGLPKALYWPLILVIICLFLDLVQYFYKSFIFWRKYRKCEKKIERKGNSEKDFRFDPNWNNFSYLIFYSKAIALIISYFLLAKGLSKFIILV